MSEITYDRKFRHSWISDCHCLHSNFSHKMNPSWGLAARRDESTVRFRDAGDQWISAGVIRGSTYCECRTPIEKLGAFFWIIGLYCPGAGFWVLSFGSVIRPLMLYCGCFLRYELVLLVEYATQTKMTHHFIEEEEAAAAEESLQEGTTLTCWSRTLNSIIWVGRVFGFDKAHVPDRFALTNWILLTNKGGECVTRGRRYLNDTKNDYQLAT